MVLPQQFTSATDIASVMTAIDEQQEPIIGEVLGTLGLTNAEVIWRRPIGALRDQQAFRNSQY